MLQAPLVQVIDLVGISPREATVYAAKEHGNEEQVLNCELTVNAALLIIVIGEVVQIIPLQEIDRDGIR